MRIRYNAAIREALLDEMSQNESVIVLGEDVRHSLRGITKGLYEEFGPKRVLDTPISEGAFTGFATGLAMEGYRPLVEFQIAPMLYLAFDQIVNQAQKIRSMTGGQVSVPITYLVPGSGARVGLAAQHSDHPYALFVHSGVKTLLPSRPSDAYGLTRAAIRDPDPVLLFAPAALLGQREELTDREVVPMGVAAVIRPGSDVTIIALGRFVPDAVQVAELFAPRGIDVEVIDPRSLLPMDWSLLTEHARATGRVVVVDDAPKTSGIAAEVAATLQAECWSDLKAPIARACRSDGPIPFSPILENAILPDIEKIEAAVGRVIDFQ